MQTPILDRIQGHDYRNRVGVQSRWVALAIALGVFAAAPAARAAYPTRVLSALEKTKTFPDLNIQVSYDRSRKRAKITREWVQDEAGERVALDVKELEFEETIQRLLLDLRVGIYHDLEFHLQAPIVLSADSSIKFASGVEGRSTLTGSPNADDPFFSDRTGNNYRYPITAVPGERERSGLGDMTFGLSWSPFVDSKDEAYPTLTLRADLIAPTGKVRDPADVAALPGGNSGGVGLGVTTFDLSIAVSRRLQIGTPAFDPYMLFGAQLPIATPKQKTRGMEPPTTGRFKVGTEVVIAEEPKEEVRYAVDVSFGVKYIGIGRTYSELSDYLPNFNQTLVTRNRPAGSALSPAQVTYDDFDNPANYDSQTDGASCGTIRGVPCGELNRVDEHLQIETGLAFHIRPVKYATFRAGVAFSANTDHLLTTERVGSDQDPTNLEPGANCIDGPCAGRVNAQNSQGVDERSPYYDPRYDAPGRRLKVEETTILTFFFGGTVAF